MIAGAARGTAVQAMSAGGAQAVFRATLDALARPGTVRRLPPPGAEPLAAQVPAALLPLLALADLTTPACVLAGGPGRDGAGRDEAGPNGTGLDEADWDGIVRVATGAPRSALGEARLVAALRRLAPGELAGLRTGTAAAPEDGALACLAVAGIAAVEGAIVEGAVTDGARGWAGDDDAIGRRLLRVSGPGVPGRKALIVTGLPMGFVADRQRLVAGFPAGADLLLITPDGAMTGLPRTTVIAEEAT